MGRPGDLFDRVDEWADLDWFAAGTRPGLDIGIVSGRRRQGKSYLLRRLAAAHGGIYALALEEERRPALDRFGRGVTATLGLPAELRFEDWTRAIRLALGLDGGGRGRLVVLDEFPYLLRGSPELTSALQAVYDDARDESAASGARLILCGSAFAIMSELLSGARPLRGRARLDLVVRPFDFRLSREFWGIEDLDVAFRLHAIMGGTPGYRDLTDGAPQSLHELDGWLAATVLNPAHALFGEADYLLREDPRITDRALYHSVLGAVAAGSTTPAAIGAALGRDARSLPHPLDADRVRVPIRRGAHRPGARCRGRAEWVSGRWDLRASSSAGPIRTGWSPSGTDRKPVPDTSSGRSWTPEDHAATGQVEEHHTVCPGMAMLSAPPDTDWTSFGQPQGRRFSPACPRPTQQSPFGQSLERSAPPGFRS